MFVSECSVNGFGHTIQVKRSLTGLSIGCNESFNGSLRDELLNGEIFYSLAEARILIEAWRRHYNTVRPHSTLGSRPPAPEAVPSSNNPSGPLGEGWSPPLERSTGSTTTSSLPPSPPAEAETLLRHAGRRSYGRKI